MWERAEQFHVQRGGRFLTRPGVLFLCVPSQTARAIVHGYLRVHWHEPAEDMATLALIAWDEANGGTEEEVWQAMELLAGRAIR